jgi:hypothetical protein
MIDELRKLAALRRRDLADAHARHDAGQRLERFRRIVDGRQIE